LVYSFVNNEVVDFDHDLKLAQGAVDSAQAQLRQADAIADALEQEIQHVTGTLARRQAELRQALANLVADSPAFTALLKANDEAWQRLRSIRVCFGAIHDIVGAYIPQNISSRWQAVEPLDERIGYEVDQDLIGAWREALQALLQDADAELPPA
jgi:hypothetical protein